MIPGSSAKGLLALLVVMTDAAAAATGPPAAAVPEPTGDQLLQRAIARFRSEDYGRAAVDLRRLHAADPTDVDVALLLGVALYRARRPEESERVLRAVLATGDEETRAAARIFLGLIARDRGAIDAARAELGRAASASVAPLAEAGRTLLRGTGPRLLTLTFLLRPEFDSNVPLLPETVVTTDATDRADGDLLLLASASLRPFRGVGFSIDEVASYRQQFRLTDYDLFANVAGAGYAWFGRHDRVIGRYGFELMTLGGSLYTLGHVAQGAYRRALVRRLGALVSYVFRHREYLLEDFAAFTGPSHTGTAGLGWGTDDDAFEVEARFVALREDAADPAFSATGLGASLHARVRIGARASLAVSGWAIRRDFEAPLAPPDPDRVDWQLHGDLSVAVDVHRYLGLIAGATVLRNLSTSGAFDYLKITAHVGLAVGWAGP